MHTYIYILAEIVCLYILLYLSDIQFVNRRILKRSPLGYMCVVVTDRWRS